MRFSRGPAPGYRTGFTALSVHREGLRIARAHGYHLYDSLMLAAALEASCTIFYSEYMNSGRIIWDLTIRNPFG